MSYDIVGLDEFKAAMEKLNSCLQAQVHRYLTVLAEDLKIAAVELAPSKTGYLRSKIYALISEWVVNLGADASYAYFVEFGTRYMRAHPFMTPALEKYLPQLEKILLEAIEAAKTEANL